jgi:hypothetical protein
MTFSTLKARSQLEELSLFIGKHDAPDDGHHKGEARAFCVEHGGAEAANAQEEGKEA